MNDALLVRLYKQHPTLSIVAIIFTAALCLMLVGHVLYLVGFVLLGLIVIVAVAVLFGAKHGHKPSNNQDRDSDRGRRP
jgi:predicted branched-subunit amino acid permease